MRSPSHRGRRSSSGWRCHWGWRSATGIPAQAPRGPCRPTGPAARRPAWSAGRRSGSCTTPPVEACSAGSWMSRSTSSRSGTGSPRNTRRLRSSCMRVPSSRGGASPWQSTPNRARWLRRSAVSPAGRQIGWLRLRWRSPVATRPVYSTWYTFTQDLEQAAVEAETALAVGLGCGSVFVDDGWQPRGWGRGYAGCGDWRPDPAKFPDLAAFSAAVHDHGAGVVLWIAPLLLGTDAGAFGPLAGYAPHWVDRHRCHILDPRHREVREHLADICRRLVVDYALDGLKIDFLDQAMVYRGTPSTGDIDDVGEAMRAMLASDPERAGRDRPRRRGCRVPPAVREPGDRGVRADPARRRLPR